MRRAPAVFLATVAAGLLAQRTGAADDHAYWEQRLPNLENPAQGVRPKVRARATDANLIALAQAGFGGVEVGIDWSLPPAQAREQLHELLQTARRVGLQLDLAPGGAQPYQRFNLQHGCRATPPWLLSRRHEWRYMPVVTPLCWIRAPRSISRAG
jgi:hypothetical protein